MKTRKNFVEKTFMDKLEETHKKRKTFTENMAVAYATSGSELLDFNFKLSQFRKLDERDIMRAYSKVFFEDPLTAVKFAFYVGDVRGGLGERKTFRACMKWLAIHKPEICEAVLRLIPVYTRWDNLVVLVDEISIRSTVIEIIKEQLREDCVNKKHGSGISLLAKWMPSINASSKETKARAALIARCMGATPREYRKMLSMLREYLDVTEVKTSSNRWGEIDYETVPSMANLKYGKAFMKHDSSRRKDYLSALSNGTAKINASVAQPHDIVAKYYQNIEGYGWRGWHSALKYDETLEQMWKALPNIVTENTLVVRDGSASMTSSIGDGKTTCLDVATALAIYCSEHNSPAWKDKFITFSSRPEIVNLRICESLKDKLTVCDSHTDCSNTDIVKTMELILETAVENNMSQEEMPRNILIISDMQFDGRHNSWNRTLFEEIALEYDACGYQLPRIIFWNVSDRFANTIPMQDNEKGLILCSGFSINNMKMFMTGEVDPLKVLLEQVNSPRYAPVETALLEGH